MTAVAERIDWEALWAPKPTPPPAPTGAPVHLNGNASKYAQAALSAEVDTLRATVEPGRNQQLNKSAFNLYQLVAAGHLQKADVDAELQAAARHTGLDDKEITNTLRSAWNGGQQHPRAVPQPNPLPTVYELESATDFWELRPVLTHIRDYSRSCLTSPWAVLGVSLLRCLATIPPHVVLPPLIGGGGGSLNQFIALVGRSGGGKGTTESTALDCFDFDEDIYTASVGSGEGICHLYAHRERSQADPVRDRDSVLFSVPEVDTLTALGSRQGSTLLSQLRSAFSGERLGFGYADPVKRLPLERHTYRLGMIVGVQPERGGPIIYDSDGGTPQRFIWLPTNDPKIDAAAPPPPPRWLIKRQDFPSVYENTLHRLSVPDSVAKTIRENYAARARGEGDALDGHAMFAREKVAQALCFLDGRRAMTEDDWQLSATVMHVSDITRAGVQATLQAKMDQADETRAKREASRALTVSETLDEAALQRVSAWARRKIGAQGGPMTHRELFRAVSSRDRDRLEEAIERLIAAGQIKAEEEAGSRRFTVVGGTP